MSDKKPESGPPEDLPTGNRKDYEELPQYLRKGLQVKFAEHFDDVYQWALTR